jgi:peptide/nickel transport system permease protein
VIALQLAWLAGGVLFVEYRVLLPGHRRQPRRLVRNSDFPMVQVLAMVIAAVYVGVNLIADVLSILFTPRARTAIAS